MYEHIFDLLYAFWRYKCINDVASQILQSQEWYSLRNMIRIPFNVGDRFITILFPLIWYVTATALFQCKNYKFCQTKVSPTRQKITPTIFIPILFIFLDSHHNSKQQHTQRKNFLRLSAHVIYCRSIINHYLLIHNVFSSRNRNALS